MVEDQNQLKKNKEDVAQGFGLEDSLNLLIFGASSIPSPSGVII